MLLIGWVGSAAQSAATDHGLRLHELMQSSLKDSSQQKSSQLLMSAAVLRHSAEEKEFWPNLMFESSHGRSETAGSNIASSRNQSNGWISQLSIGSSWQLLDNGESGHRLKLSEFEMLSAKLEQSMAGLENRHKLACAFFSWQKNDVQEEIDREVRQILTAQFKQTERQFRQGLKTSRDYQRMRAELKRLELQDTSKAFRNADVIHQISELSGMDTEQLQTRGAANLQKLPDSGAKLVAQLMHGTGPSVQDELDRLKLERARAEAQRADHLRIYPEVKFTLSAQYGSTGYIPEFEDNFSANLRPSWSAIVSINHELWDWGVRRARAQAGWESFRAEEIKLDESRRGRQAVRQLRQIKLSELAKQYDLAVELLKLEQSNFDVVQSEFRQGKLSYLDMITALRELSSARRQRFDFYFQIVDQLAEIHFAEGNLDEWSKNF
jgi:outer membrane protein TolC